MYKGYVKRLLDIVLALAALVPLLPLMLAIALWIKLDSPGPVLFKQKRVGKHKTHFWMLKFRTMRTDAPRDMPTHLLGDPTRYISNAGRILRKLSADEIPQVFHILSGKMSLIGPRPALWNQYDLIAERERCGANALRPGLTGWAQINGRDEISIEEKARYDGEYAHRISFLFDCRCFFGTIGSVFAQKGVVEGGTGALEQKGSEPTDGGKPNT